VKTVRLDALLGKTVRGKLLSLLFLAAAQAQRSRWHRPAGLI
jgi:hypothetical protein